MFFVAPMKMKGKVTQAFVETTQKACKNPPPGIKYHSVFCTIGQYDFVITLKHLTKKKP